MDEEDEKDSEDDILTGFTNFVDNNLRVFRVSHSSVFSHASLQLLFGGTKAVESLKLKGSKRFCGRNDFLVLGSEIWEQFL